jgi:hypothetical protein
MSANGTSVAPQFDGGFHQLVNTSRALNPIIHDQSA